MSLKTFMDFAITNAERLDAMNEGKTPASSAPGTKVHELIKHLRPYLKVGRIGRRNQENDAGKQKIRKTA